MSTLAYSGVFLVLALLVRRMLPSSVSAGGRSLIALLAGIPVCAWILAEIS